MGNLRFSKVWHITVSQSVADVGGQTWSPFSVSYFPFRAVTLLCSWRGFDSVGKSLVTRWFHMQVLHAQISLLKLELKHWTILYSVLLPSLWKDHMRGFQSPDSHLDIEHLIQDFWMDSVISLSCDSFNLHIFAVTAFPTGGADTVFFQQGYYCVAYSLCGFSIYSTGIWVWHKGLSKWLLDQWRTGNRKLRCYNSWDSWVSYYCHESCARHYRTN